VLPPNTVPPDVALLGRARVGKDTAAAILARKWGHERLAFADPLRAIAADVDPYVAEGYGYEPMRYAHVVAAVGYDRAKGVAEVRQFLQRLGVAVRDHLGEDVWVRALESRVEALDALQPVVLTDVRFPNEVDYARDAGMVVVRLTRSGAGAGEHVSETALDGVDADFTYANDGSLDALEGFLDGVVLSRPRSL
jgi:hypothetical protein